MSYISLPYPVLPSVPSIIAEDINSSHKEHLKLHAIYGTEGRKTRQSSEVISARIIEEWRDPWVERWMEDQVKCETILNWLHDAILIDFEQPLVEALNLFLSVQVLVSYGEIEQALQELSSWQRQIGLNLFNHQKNLALDLINQYEDELQDPEDSDLDSDNDSDEDYNDDDYSDDDSNDDSDDDSDDDYDDDKHHHQRQKIQNRRQRDPSPDKTSYLPLCKEWNSKLRNHLLMADGDGRSAKDLEIGHREVARAIQAMKKHTYNFQTSGLARTILELTNRSAYYDKPHQASYARRFGFGLVLGDVLGRWTPDEWAQQAEESLKENPPAGYNKSGRDLIEAITSHPNLIPNVSNPAAIFFLCSSDNFQFAWRRWLSWGLDAAGYRVWDCNSEALYRRTMQYLQVQRLNQRQWDRAKREWNEIIFFIIERSMELRNLLKDVDKQTHQPNILHCTKCASEVPEKRCVQRIDVELNTDPDFVERWEGVGVTKVPPEERMKPRKGRKASEAAEIVDPDEIGLRKIAIRDEEVIQRCGKHIFLLFSKQKLQDFIWYNAFSHGPNGTFDRLVRYSQTPLGVQPVLRGGKFDFWVVGQMIPFGARQPSGGHLADHYTFYQGINADTLWGITVLFEQAEMSATILATARAVHPDLVKKIKNQSALCERVGLCGLNLFNCSGYTAPQHYDKDATPSLCAQFVLQAEKKWSEFAFCALQYGYYFESHENTLWSFDSTLLHGTMLPSENTILRLRGGANSVGTHTTTRERDRRRAERNERTINNYHLRQRAWAGHENVVV
ncbi:hypothetical protein C8R41DRAFT_916257 [Lentinula lateritia]|uniref:Uncharacterized protein n=1 Tax=Lentinula lateritia TaxID=40482 RepID=A0ABQ8VU63_9AGAR|nr:hypothetical protein C8R41DRAFT_916257 [Lentinula lateritia]